MPVPEVITKLIERFDFHRQSYISPRSEYNETKLRQDYLDHFFIALGWDVYNTQGWSEQAREVSLEQTIKIQGTTDFIDYSFKIGRDLKFIAEAKTPRVRIKDNTKAAYQVRRYAWNAKLSLCILTNFDEFRVYDCTKRPSGSDAPSVAHVDYFTYKDLPAKWDWLVSVFSKDAVYKGSFDRFAESTKGKKGTVSVDDEFLTEIENWRDILAKNIALRNTSLSVEELNYSVQTIIDRIIFLRICEDRGLEQYETLKALLETDDVYLHLSDMFRRADTKYNSGIFYFEKEPGREEPDTLTLSLNVDDRVLKEILKRLYPPESPYEFSVIPTAILGHVYEQFLGKIIRLTEGHQAKVEYKPEVKKAGGVFYTPQYIVEYIVRHTVEELVKGKTPREVSQIRILDPACGSGSFLIGAYQSLLDWHLEWYIQNLAPLLNLKTPVTDTKIQTLMPEPIPKNKKLVMPVELPIYPTGYSNGVKKLDRTRSDWALSTTEKKRILLKNIFGVDIDHQAVEVTKLSLLLKVLEGENEENISQQLKLFSERALPSLHQNIKCGNSLIGTDIYADEQVTLDQNEARQINPFDWELEFADVMKAGGFNVVIGNPPYVRMESLDRTFKDYAKNNYKSFSGRADLYVYFIEKAQKLLNKNGFFGIICASKFMRAKYGINLRDFIIKNFKLHEIIDFGELPVFQNASTFPAIFIAQNESVKEQKFVYTSIKRLDFSSLSEEVKLIGKTKDNRSLDSVNWTLAEENEINLIIKMNSKGKPLGEVINHQMFMGIKSGLTKAFEIDLKTKNKIIELNPESAEIIKPFINGKNIRRYHLDFENIFLIYTHHGIDIKKYPAIIDHLNQFKEELKNRATKQEWYELQQPQYGLKQYLESPKILLPDIAKESRMTYDTQGHFVSNTVYFIPTNDLYLFGILNSKLIFNYYKRISTVIGDADKGGRLRWFRQDVERIPLRTINFSDPIDKARHDRMVALVTQMLDLNKKLQNAKMEQEKTGLSRQIEATDTSIDKLVFELYGLTEEEIKIVESK
ncbi:MAG: Eco57I restriction-modification methylase domain-containing protein [Methanoregula sp.]|nr:Eco57I restriction-modification methylase domain-containing protein [Methanoregula sp.]